MRLYAIGGLAVLFLATTATAQDAPYQKQARDIYAHVVGMRSSKGHGGAKAESEYLAGVLKAGGVAASDIAMLPLGETQAMVVRIPGSDASRKPILFSAHMDVVDARPEDWQRDPFTLVEEGGNFFGRGTSDNKAGVAALASTILRLKADGFVPKRTLVFGFVGDEETEMATTKSIAEHEWVKGAEFAINADAGGGLLDDETGKPLIYLIQGAEKTYATFELLATNPGGHSSRPRADNAIYSLVHALAKLEAFRFPVMANELSRAYLGAVGRTKEGKLGEALRAFSANPEDETAIEVLANTPEFVGTTRTTCVATMLDAGHAENALPQKAKATVNCRIFPGVPVDEVRDTIAKAIADPQIAITTLQDPQASPVSEMRDDVVAAITASVRKHYPDVPIVPYLESGATDGKVYRTAGIPTYASSGLFAKPTEMFAHGLDERLPVRAFYEGVDHIHDLAVAFGGAR
ncbi:MAG TPA: M20/M25/M40 family metallo-hydrolase [Xanthomonadales bacterium]|nr:M20/M25/M40 family metallo-hydrolase [Xanthomonadales bacterium]